ncbi:flagellin lysine-N-methylase [Yersinia enterocolitica]|nr:flagellin lysine-N-methylase [Yersinia enterocolitica]EKN3994625.1 flagellin lysine-N-methylase [Yersinia enterocolitica]EKN5086371.1 flagellar protein FliB [Yersinia enterocolitica]EKN6403053.1 flagellar protein FliB [Yersinia enterocolitica]EKP3831598.1 flagellin lysine-N-methylase [Yersinia enterocolitica]
MKELMVVQPDYVANFSCVGAACRDHCCKRWSITLDKQTYRKYTKSQNAEIRRIAITDISVSRASFSNWAEIKLNEHGNCPYLDQDQLCKVHKRLGADALSETCSSYPRLEHVYRHEKRNSLNISCPEAARQVLFNPTALNMQSMPIQKNGYFRAPELNIEGQLINLFCANFLMSPQPRIEENLYSIASFLLYCQKLEGTIDSKLPAMEAYFEALLGKLQGGSVTEYLENIPFNQNLQWQLLIRIQQCCVDSPNSRGRETLYSYLGKLIEHLVVEFDNEQLEERMKLLSAAWNDKALLFFSDHPHVLRNYFLYRLHHNQFAIRGGQPLLKEFYLLMVDFFFIRSLISAHILKVGQITEDDVIDIFYSYHVFRQHSAKVEADFRTEIDKVKINDDLSLLQLLV